MVFYLALASSAAGQNAARVADQAAILEGRAILVKGTYAIRGLPFFPPNVIQALGGEYALGGYPSGTAGNGSRPIRIPVWYTRERVFFGGPWKRTSVPAYTAYSLERGEGGKGGDFILALANGSYILFFAFPEDRPRYRELAAIVERRFAIFFANAKNDAELSFPAYVDIKTAAR